MKKILLSLGAVASVAAPVAATMSCGSTESIGIDFNLEKGSYAFNVNSELASGNENGLVNFLKEESKQEVSKMPQNFKDLYAKVANIKANMSNDLSVHEALLMGKELLQEQVNILYKMGNVVETLNITFDNKLDTTVLNYDATSFYTPDVQKGFSNINQNNFSEVFGNYKKIVIDSMAHNTKLLFDKLKTNQSVISWSKTLNPQRELKSIVAAKSGMTSMYLGDTEAEIRTKLLASPAISQYL